MCLNEFQPVIKSKYLGFLWPSGIAFALSVFFYPNLSSAKYQLNLIFSPFCSFFFLAIFAFSASVVPFPSSFARFLETEISSGEIIIVGNHT